jgi:hypothetical protein
MIEEKIMRVKLMHNYISQKGAVCAAFSAHENQRPTVYNNTQQKIINKPNLSCRVKEHIMYALTRQKKSAQMLLDKIE